MTRAYHAQARAALDAGRYVEAKDAANQALRLISDDAVRSELLGILRKSYAHLPAYQPARDTA